MFQTRDQEQHTDQAQRRQFEAPMLPDRHHVFRAELLATALGVRGIELEVFRLIGADHGVDHFTTDAVLHLFHVAVTGAERHRLPATVNQLHVVDDGLTDLAVALRNQQHVAGLVAVFGKPLLDRLIGFAAGKGLVALIDHVQRPGARFRMTPLGTEVMHTGEGANAALVRAQLQQLLGIRTDSLEIIDIDRQVSDDLTALVQRREDMEDAGLIRLAATRRPHQQILHGQDPQRTKGMVCSRKRAISAPTTITIACVKPM
ncbi:hypothetical protein D3C84_490980 [compost metagenome]